MMGVGNGEIAAEVFAGSEEEGHAGFMLMEQPKDSKPILPQNQCFHVAGKLLCCFSLSSCLIHFLRCGYNVAVTLMSDYLHLNVALVHKAPSGPGTSL